nr:probable endochitinase isoform X2 [Procambarus clarkii]
MVRLHPDTAKFSLLMLVVEGLLSAPLISAQMGPPCDDSISEQCHMPDDTEPQYFPVEDNCSQYCECSDGVAYLLSCAPGTFFDVHLNICNWSYLVDCGDRSTVTSTPTTSTTTTPSVRPPPTTDAWEASTFAEY